MLNDLETNGAGSFRSKSKEGAVKQCLKNAISKRVAFITFLFRMPGNSHNNANGPGFSCDGDFLVAATPWEGDAAVGCMAYKWVDRKSTLFGQLREVVHFFI